MTSITLKLREKASSIWEKIFEHPFVVELYQGTLPREKFVFYVLQDYNYLVGLVRALTIIASKADFETSRKILELAHAEATIEIKNYEELLSRLGYTLKDAISIEPAPTNIAYTNFMISTSALGTVWEGLVALLPCFWSYAEIAEYHRDKLEKNPVSLYVDWARVYLSEEYRKVVDELRDLIDSASIGTSIERLESIFIQGSRYEYMFWDMAHKMEKWPI